MPWVALSVANLLTSRSCPDRQGCPRAEQLIHAAEGLWAVAGLLAAQGRTFRSKWYPGWESCFSFLVVFNSTSFLFSAHRFMLSSRDLMPRRWTSQVGSVPPLGLTSPAHQPTPLASEPLGNSTRGTPLPSGMPCCFQASPMLVSVQTCISSVTKDEEHSMCQIVLVSFLILLSLSLWLLP